MPIVATLLTIMVATGIRLALEQSKHFQKHTKVLSPTPLGL